MTSDFIVIGAGMAGASAAWELAAHGSVVLIEREQRPGYHSTGRSAAFYTLNYGNQIIRALTDASGDFFRVPPDGFTESPLIVPHATVTIARADQQAGFRKNLAAARASVDDIEEISPERAERMIPVLKPGYAAFAHLEPNSFFLDVALIHDGFLRAFKARGGRLVCDAEVTSITRAEGTWRVSTKAGAFESPVVVDAAGAWADEVARIAGAAPVGLTPLRRTAIIVAPPEGVSLAGCPLVIDADEAFYFRPEAGKLLASPADQTPSPPCDAQPEEEDVAITVDRLERATTVKVRRVEHKWAGLRSFVADRAPVVGPDPACDGFVWLAGQGGYGIMTAPAMARAACALASGTAWPADLAARGLSPETLAPRRASLAQAVRS
jgi:D-arginine dehydrogenase